MNEPFDFFTLAHGLVGFFLGKVRLSRQLGYLVAIGWEVFQLFFQHRPQGIELEAVWLDSVIGLMAFIVCYEFGIRY